MKAKRIMKVICLTLWILFPIVVSISFTFADMGAKFNSWGFQEDGSFVNPGWEYIWLLIFKLSIYIIPALIGTVGFYYENKENISQKRFLYYFVKALNWHFLILLSLKLLADSIFELDRIWGLALFNSIKDVQTLIGYIVTLLVRKNIKIVPGVTDKKLENNL